MHIETLELLVDLAETGSFSETAERCHISQSAVSQRIRSLEGELGVRLVERGRGRRGKALTETGEEVLAAAREIVARYERLRLELAERDEEVGGTIRVATVYSIGLHALAGSLRRFLAEHPRVHLNLEYLRTDRIYDALRAGTIDCGIVACPRERPAIEVVPLAEESMVLIAAPRHPLATAPGPLAPAVLAGLPFIAFDPDIPTRALIDDWLRGCGISVAVVQAFDNIETIKNMVEIGVGVAIVPEPTVVREASDGALAIRTFAGPPLTRPTGILLRRGQAPRRALARFLAVLHES